MGTYGHHEIDDTVACIIRQEAAREGVPEWLALGIAGAESAWFTYALGDAGDAGYLNDSDRPGVIDEQGFTWRTYDPSKLDGSRWCSIGLLQLNTCGGQGGGYDPRTLFDPTINMRIGLPPIAVAYARFKTGYADNFDLLVREVARNSGHPGMVDITDYRLTAIVSRTLEVIFAPDGTWAQWPTCVGLPSPPPPPTLPIPEIEGGLEAIQQDLEAHGTYVQRRLSDIRELLRRWHS